MDVVVVGSGAAGLVAALAAHDAGATVGVYEKGDRVGGTTAVSGGMVWIPANPHEEAAGIEDSVEEGVRYLLSLSHGLADERLVRTLVETGPEMVEWVERATPLRFAVIDGYPDYQPEHPGGQATGGRALEVPLYPFGELGEWAARVLAPARAVNVVLHELPMGGGSGVIPPEVLASRQERDERGIGQGLVGALLRACLDRGIEPVTGARAAALVVEDGRVVGVRFAQGEEVRAQRGVVLATGGFERDEGLVRSFLRGPMTAPTGAETNTGDGLRMAMRVGAGLGNMREAWWVPVMTVPGPDGVVRRLLVLRERTLPRSILVNRHGVRFVNEAANYNALGGAFHVLDPVAFDYPNVPAWLIFDHEYLRRYGVGPVPPGTAPPAWLATGATLVELARAIEVDPEALPRTVATFNEGIRSGRDPGFGRGDSAYDHWAGDRTQQGRATTLGPIDTPPYHAVRLDPGCLGTNGGPRTDEHARVLDVDGALIPGLLAAGNVMAAPTGMAYGGAGGTLGPAMTFGYIAGRTAASGR